MKILNHINKDGLVVNSSVATDTTPIPSVDAVGNDIVIANRNYIGYTYANGEYIAPTPIKIESEAVDE